MPIDVLTAYYHTLLVGLQSALAQFHPWFITLGWVVAVVTLLSFVVRVVTLLYSLVEPSTYLIVTPPRQTDTPAATTRHLFHLLHGLLRYRPLLTRFFLPPARYSFEIVSRKGSGIQYLVRVPARQAEVVTKSLRGYLPDMEIKQTDDYHVERGSGVVEFGLQRHFAVPLAQLPDLSTHDPIAYLTNAMTQLGPNELMALQVVVRPVSRLHDFWMSREIRRVRRLSERGALDHPDRILQDSFVGSSAFALLGLIQSVLELVALPLVALADGLTGTTVATVPVPRAMTITPPASPSEQALRAEIVSKLEQPLFITSVRALIRVDGSGRTREQGVVGSFQSFTSVHNQGLAPKLGFCKSWRFRSRQLGGSTAVLAPSELASLFHFPQSSTSETEDLVRVRSRELPAPLSFKHATPNFDTVFATNTYHGTRTPIGLTLEERRRHTYIVGATGSGKTTLLATMIHSDITNGKGVAVIDPHGQLVEQLLRTIPSERIKDIVWFAPDDDGYPIALNLLELPNIDAATPSQRAKQKSLVASHLISVFQKFYDAKYFGPRMEYVLRNAILTALETPTPTLVTILDLLTKKDFRRSVTSELPTGVLKDFWTYEFEKLGSLQRNQMISPITNKLGAILSSPLNYQILSQAQSKLDFSSIMDEGKILLCDLSKGKIGEDESNFFGSLVIAKLQLAALGRARIPETDRRDFFLYVDEFQNFATGAFAELVSEARKYRLATILAHQSISQIAERDVIKVVLANVGTTICFRTANPEDEHTILPILAPEVEKHDIPNLPLYRFYMKVAVGEARAAFMADVMNFTVDGSDERADEVIATSRARYATRAGTVSQVPGTVVPGFIRFKEPAVPAPIPIQERSSAGVGRKGQIRNTQTTMPPTPLTPKQLELLTFLARFRFLSRTHIQQLLNHQDHRRIQDWLNDLTDKQYLARIESKTAHDASKPIYHLAPKALGILKTLSDQDTKTLEKLYREAERSDDFVRRCLLLADLYIDLRTRTTKQTHFTMVLPDQFSAIQPYATLLAELAPHAFVIRQQHKTMEQSFVEVLVESSRPRLMQQIRRYLALYDTNAWQTAGDHTFPMVLLIAPNDATYTTAKSLVKKLLSELELEVSHPTVRIAAIDSVRKHGLTGDAWEELCTAGTVV